MMYTRRDVGKLTLAAVPGMSLLASAQTRPNSKVAGVQIGLNVPYNFGNLEMTTDEILKHCVTLGVSGVEMRARPVEAFLGAPANLLARGRGAAAVREDLRKWRLAAPLDKAKAVRKQYEDAGVAIEIVKFDDIYPSADDVIDYGFELTKALGARALSLEIDVKETKRFGQFADKHRVMVGYHGHMETTPAHWEEAFSYAKYNGANLDIGHFVAGNNTSPIAFMKQHHARITHIHVKDRKLNKGPNVPFGQGDTPIGEVLRLIRDNRWNIQATIEFEYPVPAGSDRMTEMAKCVEFCRTELTRGA